MTMLDKTISNLPFMKSEVPINNKETGLLKVRPLPVPKFSSSSVKISPGLIKNNFGIY